MSKLLAAIVAATFALGAAPGYAKTEELSNDQRAELRQRAERLTAERAAHPTAHQTPAKEKAGTQRAPKSKKQAPAKEQPRT
jgi:hypothetical protein